MKRFHKIVGIALTTALTLSLTACNTWSPAQLPSQQGELSATIPTNVSTNTAWGGGMCEANGFVYYIASAASSASGALQGNIIRMKPDGSQPTTVISAASIWSLTASNSYLYYTEPSGVYRFSLEGGASKEVLSGVFDGVQYAGGKLYWMDQSKIECANEDGSDVTTLIDAKTLSSRSDSFDCLFTANYIYCCCLTHNDKNTLSYIYRMDLSGKNARKVYSGKLAVDYMFEDNGNLYFLLEHFNGAAEYDMMYDSVEAIGIDGTVKTVISHVGYYPQDYSLSYYCGVSDDVFYYFVDTASTGNIQLRQYDVVTKNDTLLLSQVPYPGSAIGTAFSVRGKRLSNAGFRGLYIVGNDIYYALASPPGG